MSKCKVLVLQENYEYYECDEQGQPTGDMVDHNYDTPYRYVVYDTENELYLEEYDTYEGAKDSVDRYKRDGEFDFDYADDVKMWELVKFSAMADEWQPQGVYFENEIKGEEFVKSLKKREENNMSLAPDVEAIYGSYEFCEEEVRQLIEYYTEVHKAMQEQIDYYDEKDADFSRAIKLYDEMSDDCKSFADELTAYCIDWKYSDQDIVDLCEDLVKELKK